MKNLKGRVAVITGAASGIGRATAELLAEKGCALALVDINDDTLTSLATELESKGTKVSKHRVDVSDRDQMQALVSEVVTAHGAVHIVVNNAGVTVLKSFEDHTLDDLDWIMGINLWGVIYGCKFFLPELRKADEAHIVNISSLFGFIGPPGQSSYAACKFAVRGLSESLWAELRDTQIGVTSIHPGGIATNIIATVRADDASVVEKLSDTFKQHGHPPSHVARAIVRGIEGNRLRMIVGVEAFIFEWMKRLFPTWTNKRLAPTLDLFR
jgi:short-subunit dehydrogenase